MIFEEIHRANLLPIQIPWPKDKRLLKICQELLHTPDSSKVLTDWADDIGASSRTLMRMFQKETGLSYRAWLQQMHIALALSKIANGESIAQISESLGYTNPSAFSAMFKRHLGKHLSSLEVPRCRYKSFFCRRSCFSSKSSKS